MTVTEIFAEISNHIIKGLMMHNDYADLMEFMNLHGFKRLNEYQYHCESCNLRKIHRYYIDCYNALLPADDVLYDSIIPAVWRNYTRQDVDVEAKRNVIKTFVTDWISWEDTTKKLYEKKYSQLVSLNEIAAANKIKCLIHDATCELKTATRLHLTLESLNYDMSYIIQIQDHLRNHYKKEIKHVKS